MASGRGRGVQKGALLPQPAAQTDPGGSAKPEGEFRKAESRELAGQRKESLGSEGDKVSLPLCYRQDVEDRWEEPLTK